MDGTRMGIEALERLESFLGADESDDGGPFVCRSCGASHGVEHYVCPACGGFSVEREHPSDG